ncbi:YifB family Mg chelatase-like AAA ATPase [Leucobacter tenebrionis]|uniref:YifB family Mg chelatase-like AAA ATPase n=1 Tax=Leucobacter tenebrionis TaxID=2873270 RepID=UPI001CA6AF6C|nr:YifB family Mg chelatase-like AAA ATPase [Leucobacter tenebrionis]QZY52446.1 YifB family Mg chelatase-like AAA ATPase [Leucobacter tenebrionis]
MSRAVCRAAAITLTGLDGTAVMVEAAVSQQLPGMAIIGLPDTSLAEARLRVRSATAQLGMPVSERFVTVNLSPASLPKQGSGFDLAIALSALAALGHVPAHELSRTAHLGELGLDGELRRPAGLLPAAVAAHSLGFRRVMVPEVCSAEAALVPNLEVIAVADLAAAVGWYRGERDRARVLPGTGGERVAASAPATAFHGAEDSMLDMADVIGQPEAVEALVVAAAGRHHLSLLGPPGAGKTLLVSRLPSILPDLTDEESLTVSSIAALGGVSLTSLVNRPPMESPHHTASKVAIIGGGDSGGIRPGAITRACHGVLFLDEAPEFPGTVLDALRQPLESGRIEIHRARVHAVLPARTQLVLASNPCPCGNAGSRDPGAECGCSPSRRVKYLQRISGPLNDRIDLRLTVQRVPGVLLADTEATRPSSAELRRRVTMARGAAAERLRGTPWSTNAEVPGSWLRGSAARLPRADTVVLDRAYARGALTLRGYDRVLRVAWSIADLAGKPRPKRDEIAQALALRGGDPR